jgi:transposase
MGANMANKAPVPIVKLRKPKTIDRAKVIALAEQGVSIPDIAKHQGVTNSCIWRFLQRIKPLKRAVADYKKHRADLFATTGADCLELAQRVAIAMHSAPDTVLEALTPSQKAEWLRSSTIAAGVWYDKERLELGKSSSNVAIFAKIVIDAEDSLSKGIGKATLGKQRDTVTETGQPDHRTESEAV